MRLRVAIPAAATAVVTASALLIPVLPSAWGNGPGAIPATTGVRDYCEHQCVPSRSTRERRPAGGLYSIIGKVRPRPADSTGFKHCSFTATNAVYWVVAMKGAAPRSDH
jgi:hypothetical protein